MKTVSPQRLGRPEIVTLCGSTRFEEAFISAARSLTLENRIVLTVGLFGHGEGLDMAGPTKKMLDRLHLEKIRLSDSIFVLNVGGYIGLSTMDEILFAIANGKRVDFLEEPPVECMANLEKLVALEAE